MTPARTRTARSRSTRAWSVSRIEALDWLEAAAARAGKTRRLPRSSSTPEWVGSGWRPTTLRSASRAASRAAKRLRLDGVMSHLACADDAASPGDRARSARVFAELVAAVRGARASRRAGVHLDNSAGLARGATAGSDAVRPGIWLYGIDPTLEGGHALEPVMSLFARVAHAKTVAAGTPIGYGGDFRARRARAHPDPRASATPTGSARRGRPGDVGVRGRRARAGRPGLVRPRHRGRARRTIRPQAGDVALVFGRARRLRDPRRRSSRARVGTISYEILVRDRPARSAPRDLTARGERLTPAGVPGGQHARPGAGHAAVASTRSPGRSARAPSSSEVLVRAGQRRDRAGRARAAPPMPRDCAALVELVKREGVDARRRRPRGPARRRRRRPTCATRASRCSARGAPAARLESQQALRQASSWRATAFRPRRTRASRRRRGRRGARARARRAVRGEGGRARGAGRASFVCDEPRGRARRAPRDHAASAASARAGARVVIEERLVGAGGAASTRSATASASRCSPHAQDHKRVARRRPRREHRRHGRVLAAPPIDARRWSARSSSEIVRPPSRGLRAEGSHYRGVLYVGLMFANGGPHGDRVQRALRRPRDAGAPVPRSSRDLVPLLVGAAEGRLPPSRPRCASATPAVCVVMASENYPRECRDRPRDRGARGRRGRARRRWCFTPATRGAGARWETDGRPRARRDRARARPGGGARARLRAGRGRIRFDGAHWRRDIGAGAG